jgi:hypothetical protein
MDHFCTPMNNGGKVPVPGSVTTDVIILEKLTDGGKVSGGRRATFKTLQHYLSQNAVKGRMLLFGGFSSLHIRHKCVVYGVAIVLVIPFLPHCAPSI